MSNIGNKEIFSRNLRKYMSITDKKQKEICEELGIIDSTFSDWMNAKSYPRIDKIELLANYFGIKKSDLIEEKSPEDSGEELDLSDEEERFIRLLRDSSSAIRAAAVAVLESGKPNDGAQDKNAKDE